jgi:heme oxygenase-like protein
MAGLTTAEPRLPAARGEWSDLVLRALHGVPGETSLGPLPPLPDDPLEDDDLQLALYACYELHYRSFEGVDPRWEWDPALLALRAEMEDAFATAIGARVSRPDVPPEEVGGLLFELAESDPAPSLARHLEREGTAEEFREFVIHRSAYQLKEADPHTWAIPRLAGPAKAAMVEVQADEYGSGRFERMHSVLFADAMDVLGLDSSYGAYLERLPGFTLATVTLISLFGLHRKRRGSLVGHLAMFEITSPVPNRRYARALRRLGFGSRATAFYDEHVEADSVHENIAAYDMAQNLAIADPAMASDIVFGAKALLALEGTFAGRLLERWEAGSSSLLPGAAALSAT